MTCLLSAIHTRVWSTLLHYFFQPLKTQTSRRRRKGRRAKMTPRPRSCPIQSKFSSSSQWKLVRDSLTMGWTVRTLKTIWGPYNEVNLLAILTIYLIHLFERIYSREVGRVAIFSFQSSLLSREQRMSAPPSTTSTSSAATPHRSSERPWRTLSSGNTGESLLWAGSWSFNDPF